MIIVNDAETVLAKLELGKLLKKQIQQQNLSYKEVAKRAGILEKELVTITETYDMEFGKILKVFTKLGFDVEIILKKSSGNKKYGRLTVISPQPKEQ